MIETIVGLVIVSLSILIFLFLTAYIVYDNYRNKDMYARDLTLPMLAYINRRTGTIKYLPSRISSDYAQSVLGLTRAPI